MTIYEGRITNLCAIAYSNMEKDEADPEFFIPVLDRDALYDFMVEERINMTEVRFKVFGAHIAANDYLSIERGIAHYPTTYKELDHWLGQRDGLWDGHLRI